MGSATDRFADAAKSLNQAWRDLKATRDDPDAPRWLKHRCQEAMDLVADAHEAAGIHPLTEEP